MIRLDTKIVQRIASQWVQANVTPLPATFPRDEIGLLTKEEFLALRNPGRKHHETGSYDFSLRDLNKVHLPELLSEHSWSIYGFITKGHLVFEKEGQPEAVLIDGVLYYTNPSILHTLPREIKVGGSWEKIDIRREQRVKYLLEQIAFINTAVKDNLRTYKHIMQRINIQGTSYEVRAEKPPALNKGETLVILNAQGELVASALNEWGATLLVVAKEYRGQGLGKIIGEFWYKWNPRFSSGGFTYAGEANALSLWEKRVREFLARGWYTALIQQGRLTKERTAAILAGIGQRLPVERPTAAPKLPKQGVLVLVDDPTFVVYDQAFLSAEMTDEFRYEHGDEYIYGYGFFRDDPRIGSFLYTIDYESTHKKLVTSIALQMARDAKEPIYVGPGYGALLEWEDIGGVEQKGNHVALTRDLLPLKQLATHEAGIRRKQDPHGEKYNLLLEMAESKWK